MSTDIRTYDAGNPVFLLPAEAGAWVERTVQQPWVTGLLKLAEPKDLWVGTEMWLFEELRTFVGEAVYHSSDFPRTLDELLVGQPFAYVGFEAEGDEEVRELHHVLQL